MDVSIHAVKLLPWQTQPKHISCQEFTRLVSVVFAIMGVVTSGGVSRADDDSLGFLPTREFAAQDSLKIDKDPQSDAEACLQGLRWKPAKFKVKCTPAVYEHADALIRFPSPLPQSDPINDLVAVEWYLARDEQGKPLKAPAVVVVHESGSQMEVGRLLARGFCKQGIHAFLVQLPYYGQRKGGKSRKDEAFVSLVRQGVSDVRRARDAVRVLPYVDARVIALQGTSLGGFVSTDVAALDHAFEAVFILLAGGDLYSVIQSGEKDAADMREKLSAAGLHGDELKRRLAAVEPLRIAHRLDPKRTWLISGAFDKVVPLKNAIALAETAKLENSHHIKLIANHYTGIVYLPMLLKKMGDIIKSQVPPEIDKPSPALSVDR